MCVFFLFLQLNGTVWNDVCAVFDTGRLSESAHREVDFSQSWCNIQVMWELEASGAHTLRMDLSVKKETSPVK